MNCFEERSKWSVYFRYAISLNLPSDGVQHFAVVQLSCFKMVQNSPHLFSTGSKVSRLMTSLRRLQKNRVTAVTAPTS